MYGKWKKFGSVIITIAVMLAMTATPGFAGEMPAAYSDQVEATGEELVRGEIEAYTYSQETGEDEEGYNDELFTQYVASKFFSDVEGYSDKKVMLRAIRLSDMNQIIYSKLKSQIEEVAAGNSTSTVFTVSTEDLGLSGVSWTAADLGVSQLTENNQLTTEARNALLNKLAFDTGRVIDALLAQCPYELYWYDKTAGVMISGPGYSYNSSQIMITSGLTFSFSVASKYAGGQYTVSNADIDRVEGAVATANEIVSEAADHSDQDKLSYYRDSICELVSYDHEAANSSIDYGDPWQLISVFDGDESTNVVCEGYAKAFKYLCDLSIFDDQKLECILASGTMRGATGAGPHMWNIVTAGGGNYLTDVTNCDENTIGAPDQLFLAGTENGSVQDGYTFSLAGGDIYYSYDETTLETYESELVLSSVNYEGTPEHTDPVEVITAVYERATPFEVVMERDFKDYNGSGLKYYGKTFDYPDAGDKVTFTFSDGTVKNYEYEKTGSSNGRFVNTEDASDVIPWNEIGINILDQADNWEPGGDKNYYEVSFINYPEDGSEVVVCRVPVEVSSTPVASVAFEPVPVLLWSADASRSGMPEGDKVTVTYKDGTSEVFIEDHDTHSWISQKTMEPLPDNDDSYYDIRIDQDREDLSCTASYMGVTSEKNYGALYVAQSISLYQEEPMVLTKGKESTAKTDAEGNTYEEYSLYRYNWFGPNDVLTVTYKNGLGEEIDVDYATDSETSFGLSEDSPYYSGYPDDHLSDRYITIHMPDQSENHFETGKTYSMDMTFHEYGSNFDLPAFTTEGEPYKVLIKEAGPGEVTSVSITGGSGNSQIKKGETSQLKVTWEPSYAVVSGESITWTSSNPSVATVDETGLVTAVSLGSVRISAQIGDCVAYKNLEVYDEKVLSDETVSLSQTVFPYTGNTVFIGNYVLYNGESVPGTSLSIYYTAIGNEGQQPKYIGDVKAVISGVYGGYSGTATKYYTIKGDLSRSATNVNVSLDADEYTYSGSPVEPKVVSVTAEGKGGGTATLVEDQDYTVSYESNNAVGTGYIVITAVEDSYYMGEARIPFTITEEIKSSWVKDGDDWYYYDANGEMVTSKWQKDSKGWCWLQEDGRMLTNGWAKDSKGYCWIGANGYMVEETKWIKVDGSWFHITKGYRDQSKWVKDSKGWCYVGADGKMVTNGWAKDSKGWCWMGADGYWVSNKWIKSDGQWYYIKSNHYMAANEWAKDSGGWMYMDASGKITKNKWIKSGGYWYYLKSNGYMATGTQTISGKTYQFDSSGRWIS